MLNDSQAVRNAQDLNCMAVPVKYRQIGDFHEYYSGARTVPYLTIFVGGNHEASNHLWELYYGGWAAPGIYYMGSANVVRLGPLRIAGLSGIWNGRDYKKPHFERLPYNSSDVRSIYHVRELDTRKLLQIRTQVDIGISHDWPRGVEWQGDLRGLLRVKPYLEDDLNNGRLNSVAAKLALDRLRPAYWFSAHHHVKFAATIDYSKEENGSGSQKQAVPEEQHRTDTQQGTATKNEEEIDLDLDGEVPVTSQAAPPETLKSSNADEINLDLEDEDEEPSQAHDDIPTVSEDLRAQLPAAFSRPPANTSTEQLPPPPGIANKLTRFLALDKCGANRSFLQILDVKPVSQHSAPAPPQKFFRLEYDKEWLAILRVFAADLTLGDPSAQVPPDRGPAHYLPLIEAEEAWVEANLVQPGKMVIPENFELTAPVYDPTMGINVQGQPREYSNPQTRAFCKMLQIPNPFHATEEEVQARMQAGPRPDDPRFEGGHRGRGGFHGGRGRTRGRGGNRGGNRGGQGRAWQR
ncbi:lariat debranching enzyme [Coniosporium apollinis]|uniref:Lariat debranching enzyme n=2 Tax=Coniosporium TaxID=2810619 RepID=A0ABQ9P1J3_9PEZI|nr:lariat debranching enzyme [Cladosporium sp. JES 115]KAJ9667450.1 lariat debranching enzyme [Coniosporium apollinis]